MENRKNISHIEGINSLNLLIIYVCGYWNKDMPYAGEEWGKYYWGKEFKKAAQKYFGTTNQYFLNGAGEWHSSGGKRYKSGNKFAEARYNNTQSEFYKEVFKEKRQIIVVSHSMGAAFSEGMLAFLKTKNITIEKVMHFSPADTGGFDVTFPKKTFQIDIDFDPVLAYKNLDDPSLIRGIQYYGIVKNPYGDKFGHMYTKEESFVWKWMDDLERIIFTYNRPHYAFRIHKATQHVNGTQFSTVFKKGITYHYHGKDEYYNYSEKN